MDPSTDSNKQQIRHARILAIYHAAAAKDAAQPPRTTSTRTWEKDRHKKPSPGYEANGNDDEGSTCCLGQNDPTLLYCSIDENLLPFKLLYILFRGGIACIVPYLAVFLSLLSLSPSTTGVLLGLPHLVTALVTPLCGILADKFQCRKAVLLFCLMFWLASVVSVNFLRPLQPAACPEVVKNLREVSGALPLDSWELQGFECMVNESLDELSLHEKNGQAGDDKDQWKLHLSLLHLPDPFTAGPDDGCFSTTARDHENPISALGEPRVLSKPNGTSPVIGWLFEKSSLLQTFIKVFVLLSLGEVMQRPTMSLTDTATLNELGEQAWDRYGWQRSFGSAGFAVYSIVIAFVIGLMRFPQIICGLNIDIIDYRIGTVMFGGTVACAFGLLFACCFKFKYYTKAEYKFSNVLPAFCSTYYGSVMLTAFVLAVCNGCVSGYLFWHLRNLGATEITLSLVFPVRAGSELLLAFHTPRLIGCFGHVELLGAGLLVYCVRLIGYGYVTNPWLVLPLEVFHGISIALTWNVLVSFMCRAVPSECMATLQGILSGIYFGLGHGVGAIAAGFLVTAYGAVTTFYGFAFAVMCYNIVFLVSFKTFKAPRKTPSSYQMVTSKNPPW